MTIKNAIKNLKNFKKIHLEWAGYFEENPSIEADMVKTGEWDTAEKHRDIIKIYNEIIEILQQLESKEIRC